MNKKRIKQLGSARIFFLLSLIPSTIIIVLGFFTHLFVVLIGIITVGLSCFGAILAEREIIKERKK